MSAWLSSILHQSLSRAITGTRWLVQLRRPLKRWPPILAPPRVSSGLGGVRPIKRNPRHRLELPYRLRPVVAIPLGELDRQPLPAGRVTSAEAEAAVTAEDEAVTAAERMSVSEAAPAKSEAVASRKSLVAEAMPGPDEVLVAEISPLEGSSLVAKSTILPDQLPVAEIVPASEETAMAAVVFRHEENIAAMTEPAASPVATTKVAIEFDLMVGNGKNIGTVVPRPAVGRGRPWSRPMAALNNNAGEATSALLELDRRRVAAAIHAHPGPCGPAVADGHAGKAVSAATDPDAGAGVVGALAQRVFASGCNLDVTHAHAKRDGDGEKPGGAHVTIDS